MRRPIGTDPPPDGRLHHTTTHARELVEQHDEGGHHPVDEPVIKREEERAEEGEDHDEARGAGDAEGVDELCMRCVWVCIWERVGSG